MAKGPLCHFFSFSFPESSFLRILVVPNKAVFCNSPVLIVTPFFLSHASNLLLRCLQFDTVTNFELDYIQILGFLKKEKWCTSDYLNKVFACKEMVSVSDLGKAFVFCIFHFTGQDLQLPRGKGHKRTSTSLTKVPHLTHPTFAYERQPQHRDHPNSAWVLLRPTELSTFKEL